MDATILEALREAKKMAKLMNELTSCRGDDDYVWGVQKLIDDAIKVGEAKLAKEDLFSAPPVEIQREAVTDAQLDRMYPYLPISSRAELRAALEAASLSRPSPGVVKALEWVRPTIRDTLVRAETVVGVYRVWTHHEANGRWFWDLDGCERANGDAVSEWLAVSAAQSDFERRFLSALSPSGEEPRKPMKTHLNTAYQCPKCGSTRVHVVSGMGLRATCQECGHLEGAHNFEKECQDE